MNDDTTTAEVSIAGRVRTAQDNGMHPVQESEVEEGRHYEVLSYTDWADLFIPTRVRWANGETDDFTDPAVSDTNRRESIRAVNHGKEVDS
jgi:hypothetical protein